MKAHTGRDPFKNGLFWTFPSWEGFGVGCRDVRDEDDIRYASILLISDQD